MYSRIISICCSSTLALMMVTAPSTVWAESEPEEESEEDRQKAAEYYEEAAELYVDGQFERAAELLDLAFSHDPDLIYRYNQILAYQGLGDYERALEMLSKYEEAMGEEDRFDDIAEIRVELEEAIAEIEEEKAAGRAEREEKEGLEAISLPPGDKKEEESGNALAWTLVGTGGAALAGGLVLSSGVLIGDQIDRLEQSRTPSDKDDVYGGTSYNRGDDVDTLRTHQRLSIAFLGAGGVLTAVGSLMRMRNRGADEAPGETSSLRLRPVVGSDEVGARITLQWRR